MSITYVDRAGVTQTAGAEGYRHVYVTIPASRGPVNVVHEIEWLYDCARNCTVRYVTSPK